MAGGFPDVPIVGFVFGFVADARTVEDIPNRCAELGIRDHRSEGFRTRVKLLLKSHDIYNGQQILSTGFVSWCQITTRGQLVIL